MLSYIDRKFQHLTLSPGTGVWRYALNSSVALLFPSVSIWIKGTLGEGTLHLTNSPEDEEPAEASLAGVLAGGAVWAGTRDHRGVALVRCLPTCVIVGV